MVHTTNFALFQYTFLFDAYEVTEANPIDNKVYHHEETLEVEFVYASFGRRLAAFLLDYLILLIPYAIFGIVIGLLESDIDLNPKFDFYSNIFSIIIYYAYFSCMESSKYQATIGKRILGIRVTDKDGNRIRLSKAFARTIYKVISGILTLFFGYLMALFTKRKQTMHDKFASCLVVLTPIVPKDYQEKRVNRILYILTYVIAATPIVIVGVMYLSIQTNLIIYDNIGISVLLVNLILTFITLPWCIFYMVKRIGRKRTRYFMFYVNLVVFLIVWSVIMIGLFYPE